MQPIYRVFLEWTGFVPAKFYSLLRYCWTQDLDGTGRIRYTEFLAATIEAQGGTFLIVGNNYFLSSAFAYWVFLPAAISEERLAEAFDRLDGDDSGYISASNLIELLGNDIPKSEIDAIIKEADLTMDGKISYSEFLALWEDKNETKHKESIRQIREIASAYDSEGSSILSEEEGVDLQSRANFLESKLSSERKATTEQGEKHVGFFDEVTTIPTVLYEDGVEPVMNDDSETIQLKQPVPVIVE